MPIMSVWMRLSSYCMVRATIWRATREKGLPDVCVKCRFRSACAIRTGYSETILSVLCIFSVYSKSTVAQNLMES